MLYTNEIINSISSEQNVNRIKQITYAIALIVKENLQNYANRITRDDFIIIYNECKNKEDEYKGTEKEIEDFSRYYYKSIVNKLKKELSFFFMPKNQLSEEDEEER